MKSDVQKIVDKITALVDQLADLAEAEGKTVTKIFPQKSKKTKGASGALKIIIDEGFLDKPKDLPSIMDKLKQIGRYYSKQSIAMNLLNLTKNRTLNRLKDKGSKNWQYVIRK